MARFRIVGLSLLAAFMIGMAATATASATDYGAVSWGGNSSGQLGDGTDSGPNVCREDPHCSATPVTVSGLRKVTAVATGGANGGGNNGLALLKNGEVMAWGSNEYGQLGDGRTTGPETCFTWTTEPCSLTPVAVSGLRKVTAVATSGTHSLALLKNGKVMAWGSNVYGQLGDRTTTESDVPVAVSGLSGVTAIAASYYFNLALLRNGTVVAWGANGQGQLGDGTNAGPETCQTQFEGPVPCSLTPVAVSGLSGVTAIAAGGSFGMALLKNGTVMVWGELILDDKATPPEQSDVPVPVSGLNGVKAIAAGPWHRLALLGDGTVMAWGNNWAGALGSEVLEICGIYIPCHRTPVAVSGLSGVTAISAGDGFNLALLGNGTVMAWGQSGSGQLGNGNYSWYDHYHDGFFEPTPVAVCGLSEVSGISAGGDFSLAYGNDGPGAPCPKRSAALYVQPEDGPSAGGTSVTITGDNFDAATAVHFGTASATSFTVNSDTSITAVSPPAEPYANVIVTVTTPEGTSPPPEGSGDFYGSNDHFYYRQEE
jgi:alpha-tubulin suppressor-like RCC1 family protein